MTGKRTTLQERTATTCVFIKQSLNGNASFRTFNAFITFYHEIASSSLAIDRTLSPPVIPRRT